LGNILQLKKFSPKVGIGSQKKGVWRKGFGKSPEGLLWGGNLGVANKGITWGGTPSYFSTKIGGGAC